MGFSIIDGRAVR